MVVLEEEEEELEEEEGEGEDEEAEEEGWVGREVSTLIDPFFSLFSWLTIIQSLAHTAVEEREKSLRYVLYVYSGEKYCESGWKNVWHSS